MGLYRLMMLIHAFRISGVFLESLHEKLAIEKGTESLENTLFY